MVLDAFKDAEAKDLRDRRNAFLIFMALFVAIFASVIGGSRVLDWFTKRRKRNVQAVVMAPPPPTEAIPMVDLSENNPPPPYAPERGT